MCLVLDTNVWLDWLIFDDPAIAPIKTAIDNHAVEIVIDTPCRAELARVLAYPKFELDGVSQAEMMAQADRLSTLLDEPDYPSEERLPHCADPDDVKFLALAAAGKADWLITKDNALLIKRRKTNAFPVSYRVATPQQWALYQPDKLLLPERRSSC